MALFLELNIQAIFTDMTVSMSEFKKNPAAVLRQAHGRPVAVLSHNRAAFYMVEPGLFQAMLDELGGQEPGRAAGGGAAKVPDDRGPLRQAVRARLAENLPP